MKLGYSKQYLVGYLFFLSRTTAQLSICSAAAYTSLRECAAYCISYNNLSFCDYLARDLSCSPGGTAPENILNSCYCRSDLAPSAHSILSSCVSDSCSKNTVDIQQVVSLYDAYCAGVGMSSPMIVT
jgi:hypothetical protein